MGRNAIAVERKTIKKINVQGVSTPQTTPRLGIAGMVG